MEISNYIKIYNNTICVYIWEDEDWKEKSLEKIDLEFSSILNNSVEFDENLTIKGFMSALKPFKNEIETIFKISLYNHKLEHYYKSMEENFPDKKYDNMEVEIFGYGEVFDNYLNQSISIQGICEDEINYSVNLIPIYKFMNCKFYLNNNFEIINIDNEKYVLESEKDYNLLELLDGFLYNLSYFGYPEDKLKISNDIDEIVDEIDNIDNYDKINKLLKDAIEKENYEEASRLKEKLKKFKN